MELVVCAVLQNFVFLHEMTSCTTMRMSTDDENVIEILSSEEINVREPDYRTAQRKLSETDESYFERTENERRKTVTRIVMTTAIVLLLMSVILVGVTLGMSDRIDEMVRRTNQQRQSSKSLPTSRNLSSFNSTLSAG